MNPERDTGLPSNEGDAEGPGSGKVRVFKGGGVLCKGVVMDDGRLLIVEGLTEEPLLISREHETGLLITQWGLQCFRHHLSLFSSNSVSIISKF